MTNARVGQKLLYLILLSLFIIAPIPTASAHEISNEASTQSEALMLQTLPFDPDFDGIPTNVEQSGWYNASGGPYSTNPNHPDTDGDGLWDGKEQLFDTNPLSENSPGLYVEYQQEFLTRKFYPWQQHGNQLLVHSNLSPSNIRDVIVRRGTNVTVGGPPGATLNISPDGGGLTSLSATPNSCGGGWTISIPSNATAGKYTLTAQKNGSNIGSLTLYVIFDLTGANQDDIDVLGYNERAAGHPNVRKDEVAIYFDTTYEAYYSGYDPNNHDVYGWGIGWETELTSRKVFEDYVMPAINGTSDRSQASNKLGHKVDQALTIDWFKFPNSTNNALAWTTSDCTGHASLLTSFLRSAGITSRPVVVEWKNSHYDTSTEVWIGNNWQVMRPYQDGEYAGSPQTPPSPPLTAGILSLTSRSSFGNNPYGKARSDMLLVARSDWRWDQININYHGTKLRDWLTHSSTKFDTIKRWDWVETPLREYWNISPPRVIADCSTCGQAPIGVNSLDAEGDGSNPHLNTQTQMARFGEIISDRGVDLDGDGRFEQLLIEVQVEVLQPGSYTIGAVLNDFDPETRLGREVDGITGAQQYLTLEAGLHTIELAFSGRDISAKKVAGPYWVDQLWLSPLQNPTPNQMRDNLVDYRRPEYVTGAYNLEAFENGGAALTNRYTHQALDSNNDGYFDGLIVNTGLTLNEVATYRLSADLVDSQGELVETAEWSGSNGEVSLQFNTLLSQATPYYINNVFLYRDNQLLEISEETPGVYTIAPLYNIGLSAMAVTTPTVTGVTPSDTDGNGKYDNLSFDVNLTIPVAGNYRLEGWLEASDGSLISLQTSPTAALGVGSQNMTLTFSGQAINNARVDGPYKLTALKVLYDSGYQPVDEVPVAYQTQAYGFSAFQAAFNTSAYTLIDRGSSNNWSSNNTDWGLTQSAAFSPLLSWTDSPKGTYGNLKDYRLTSKAFNINNGAAAQISYQNCYDIGAGDLGKIEVNLPGVPGSWFQVPGAPVYTGGSNGWSQQNVALPPVINSDTLSFRFNLSTDASGTADGWYIDDIFVKLDYDLDDDGISNAIEAVTDQGLNPPPYPDTDGDATPDYQDSDTDGDGIPDSIEGAGDADGDGQRNFRDLDSDNHGPPDSAEGYGDSNNNGIPDFLDNPNNTDGDIDGDTILDAHENIPGHTDADGDGVGNAGDPDSDNDGIGDIDEAGDSNLNTPPIDTDKDGLPDFVDIDSDNDGFTDNEEGPGDLDGDGTPDYRDRDRDGDSMPDDWENRHNLDPSNDDSNQDADGDDLTNGDEYALETDPRNPDTDGDGLLDGEDPDPGRAVSSTFLPVIKKQQ